VTDVRVGVVDVCVVRIVGRAWKVLALRRAKGTRSPGSWELVHGHIEKGELPVDAARRELREETGLSSTKLYSIAVNPFYLMQRDTVQVALVFAAMVESERVALGAEHDRYEWLSVAAAVKRLSWPRDGESVRYTRQLLKSGDAGAAEDVLRVPRK
jgi:dihydroneopterin triphosphate diphosphatase